ncbi:hypothetical protein [uncultured Pseudodesulfovibrio sp.]|uniref:hypothetical protein n=1 Tax=uncultured Pseudodesulfovibrio sp. TaxID=2035858 RepID=UPI0029C8E1E3|nr:hypothetical protein [uncultured Pseudodesulfovibrio sp.]
MSDFTSGEVDTGLKRGGDTHQGMEAGTFAGNQADNSDGGWGTVTDQAAMGAQGAMGGDVTDNVDIGSINISS